MKYLFRRRRGISLLCIISVMLGLSAKTIVAEVNKISSGPYTFLTSGNLMILSEYDDSNNVTGDVCLENTYTASGRKYWVEGIKNTAFQKKSLSSLTVRTTKRTETEKYQIENEAFQETEIGLSSDDPKAIFQDGEITAIGARAFQGAKIGCDLVFESVNGEISSCAFRNMEVAGTLMIYGSIKRLGEYALEGAKLQGMLLTNDIREIETGAFKDTNIKGWVVPDTLKKLGSKIFEGCVLQEITLPSSNQEREIAEDAFPDQSGLTIIIPKGLTDISAFHFDNYKNLIFQTDSGLSEDSPVISWLKEHRLTYKIGKNGPLITPGDISGPTAAPTATPQTPSPSETATPQTPSPEETPTPFETVTPTEPAWTESPDQVSEPPKVPEETPTLAETATPTEPVQIESPEQASEPPTPMPTPVTDQKPASTPAALTKNAVHVIKNIEYKETENNSVTVTGTTKKTLKKLKIPDTVKINDRLYKVTGIRNRAFKGMKKLETVLVGNYVKNVGKEAFADCRKLGKIQFGTALEKLGKKVLYHDKKMAKIIFKGKKLKQIGSKTLEGVPRNVDIRTVRSKVKYYAELIKKSQR